MKNTLFRIIDANLNRSREGLRVCEDIARLVLGDKSISGSLKRIRHSATNALLFSKKMPLKRLVLTRNTKTDALKKVDFDKKNKSLIADLFMSNIERVKESLRVIEECTKPLDKNISRKYRKLRFDAYDIEKKAIGKVC